MRRWTRGFLYRTIPSTVNTTKLHYFSEPCPYVSGKSSSGEFIVEKGYFRDYESLIPFGWRRSGALLYHYRCTDCALCIPIRLPVSRLLEGRRFARLASLNRDIGMKLCPAEFHREYVVLFEKYTRQRHGEANTSAEAAFRSMLDAPMAALAEYRDAAGQLVALGFLDILPSGLSSVYFAFDPEEGRRSLGTWSVHAESALASAMGKDYYYLGFWVSKAPKMDYKADFRPFQLALPTGNQQNQGSEPSGWTEFRSKAEALAALPAAAQR